MQRRLSHYYRSFVRINLVRLGMHKKNRVTAHVLTPVDCVFAFFSRFARTCRDQMYESLFALSYTITLALLYTIVLTRAANCGFFLSKIFVNVILTHLSVLLLENSVFHLNGDTTTQTDMIDLTMVG